ncbi:hypothetical protein IV203_015005 [Nitzschia inconspicua]|uniref:Uncharacterized protein n=1 Tax=Nitzschia inconspicua TaxID=303405 RepID=A0A9K3LA29_9STRA|nr:hypothetical protein IV203_015005 [Nitzschia inconspicua]
MPAETGGQGDTEHSSCKGVTKSNNFSVVTEGKEEARDSIQDEQTEIANLATPRKKGGMSNSDCEGFFSTPKSAASTSKSNKHNILPSLGDYFERSYSSSSSEASEGGWTEVHDQSESSDTGQSVQTNGTLGSAVIIDATVDGRKASSMVAPAVKCKTQREEHLATERPTADGQFHRKKSSSIKKKKNKIHIVDSSTKLDGIVRPQTPERRKKGKKEGCTKIDEVKSVTLQLNTDGDETRAIPLSKKKKKKKSISVLENKEEGLNKTDKSKQEPDDLDEKMSPSTKKKKKKNGCSIKNLTPSTVEDKVESCPTSQVSPTKKKKKKIPVTEAEVAVKKISL